MEPICIDYVGVLEEVIQRAAFVLDALGNDKHVERLCNVNISSQDQQYKVLKGNNLRYGIWESVFLFLIIQFSLLLFFLILGAKCRMQWTRCWRLMFTRGTSSFSFRMYFHLSLKDILWILVLGLDDILQKIQV